MNFDWNWFFSSFCQSAAALIGIIGAFVISKLLGLNEKVETLISNFNSLKIESDKAKYQFQNIDFKEFTKEKLLYNSELKEIIEQDFWRKNYSAEEVLNRIYATYPWLPKLDEVIFEAFSEMHEYYWQESQNSRHRNNAGISNFTPEIDPYAIGFATSKQNDEILAHVATGLKANALMKV